MEGRNNRILYRIPARLTAAREAAGMSKNALADAMGSDVSALSKIESGERIPSTQTLANACDAMGFLMKWFFEEEETEFSRTDLLIALLEQNREGIDALPPEHFELLRAALASNLALACAPVSESKGNRA